MPAVIPCNDHTVTILNCDQVLVDFTTMEMSRCLTSIPCLSTSANMVRTRVCGAACLLVCMFSHGAAAGPGSVIERIIPNSAAASVGLMIGDVLLEYDGAKIGSQAALTAGEANNLTQFSVPLRYLHAGAEHSISVPRGNLGLVIRPNCSERALGIYRDGQKAIPDKKYDDLLRIWRSGADELEKGGERESAAWLRDRCAVVCEQLNRWDEALIEYGKAFEVTSDSAVKSWAAFRSGFILSKRQNKLAPAKDWYEKCLAEDRAGKREVWTAQRLNDLGAIEFELGQLADAKSRLSEAIGIRERILPDSRDLAQSMNELSTVCLDLGELRTAQENLLRSKAIFDGLTPDDPSQATTDVQKLDFLNLGVVLNSLGNVARDSGDVSAAIVYYERALKFTQPLQPDGRSVAQYLNNLGALQADGPEAGFAEAETNLKRALAIWEKAAPNSFEHAMTLQNLGFLARNRDDLAAAKDYNEKALEIRQKNFPGSVAESSSYLWLGDVAFRQKDDTKAIELLTRAYDGFHKLAPGSLMEADALDRLGKVSARGGKYAEAERHLASATADIDKIRRTLGSIEGKQRFGEKYSRIPLHYVDVLLKQGKAAQALPIIEAHRARALLDQIREKGIDLTGDLPKPLADRFKQLREKQRSLLFRISEPKSDAQKDLPDEFASLAVELKEVEAEVRKASPRLASIVYPEPLDLAGIRLNLDEGTLLLVYFVAPDRTTLIAVTKTDLRAFPIAIVEDELAKKTADFLKAVSGGEKFSENGLALYKLLLAPAAEMIRNAKHLLICPDGPLQTLPFLALVTDIKQVSVAAAPPQAIDRDRSRGDNDNQERGVKSVVDDGLAGLHYLSDDIPIDTVLSMTLFAEIRRTKRVEGPLIALGNPVYSGRPQRTMADVRGQTIRGLPLDPLPFTKEEVEHIKALYGDKATVFTSDEASETTLKIRASQASILHIACHGLLNTEMLASGLALSPSATDDGLLTAAEIFQEVRTSADLVVLSACETGLGTATYSEGVLGLTRAFQYAGGRSILVSLWKINDPATAIIMQHMYEFLKAGATKDEALRKAMVELRKDPKYMHPKYWGAFVLVGDYQ